MQAAPHVAHTTPEDGIQDFHFHASPPGEPPTGNTPEIKASGGIDPVPDWLEGVRGLAGSNSQEKTLG